MENEIWTVYKDTRGIKGGGNLWEVSNFGRVKRNGKLHCLNNNTKCGYVLFLGDYLHRLVAIIYVPNPDNKPCVDHIDGNKLNNRADNLRWVTMSENMNNENTKSHRNVFYIHLDNKHKYVEREYLDYWLDDGWLFGRRQ